MTTKVTDSVMDLTDVRQDITLGFNDAESRPSKIVGLNTPTQNDEATSKLYVDSELATALSALVPAGMGPLPWSGESAPSGWLLCRGQAVSRTTYSALFLAINTKWGTGNGSTTFNVPDMRGRFPLGKNEPLVSSNDRVSRTGARNLSWSTGVGGQEDVLLIATELPAHTHSVSITPNGGSHVHTGATTDFEPAHSHTTDPATSRVFDPTGTGSGTDNGSDVVRPVTIQPAGGHAHTVSVLSNNSGHNHTATIGFSPSAVAHDNTPPFLTINYIIKT